MPLNPTNHESIGRESIASLDLTNMLFAYKALPWLSDLLEEVQYGRRRVDDLETQIERDRQALQQSPSAGEYTHDAGQVESLDAHVKYLEDTLTKLGIKFMKYQQGDPDGQEAKDTKES